MDFDVQWLHKHPRVANEEEIERCLEMTLKTYALSPEQLQRLREMAKQWLNQDR